MKSIFEQEPPEKTLEEWNLGTEGIRGKCNSRKIDRMMTDKKRNALLAYTRYLKEHRPQLSGTNPIEQQNLHIKRRTRPVCIFPNDRSIKRFVGGRMTKTGEKWEDGEPYMLPDVIVAVMNGTAIGDFAVEVLEIA